MGNALTAAKLKDILRYDPATGLFHWRIVVPRCRLNPAAGSLNSHGYRQIKIAGRLYKAHRLAWLYMTGDWPSGLIDHADRNKDNNRWANLRAGTKALNAANSKRRSTGVSGYKGVSWDTKNEKFRATIKSGGSFRHLGYFDSARDANRAYARAAAAIFGIFSRSA